MMKKWVSFGILMIFCMSATLMAVEIDLLAKAESARWENGDKQVLGFGRDLRERGTVQYRPGLTLEDRQSYDRVLFIHPPWKNRGLVLGRFENITIPKGDPKLIIAGGFNQGASGTDGVQFRVQFVGEGPQVRALTTTSSGAFCTLNIMYDGKIDRAECNIEPIAGRTGTIILYVSAGDSADKDWAVLTEFKIVSSSAEEEITKQLERNLKGHNGRLYDVDFSPDGKYVVTASADRTARVWELQSGSRKSILQGHNGHVFCASFSPNSKRIVTASGDNSARIWQASSGNQIRALNGHTQQVLAACFSPDGQLVATGSEDGTVKIWQAANGKEVRTISIGGGVYAVDFSPDGRTLAIGSTDGGLAIYRVGNGSLVSAYSGHSRAVSSVEINHTGNRMVSTSVDNTAIIWNVNTGRRIQNFSGQAFYAAAFSPNARHIITGNDSRASIWVAATGERVMNVRHASNSAVRSVDFSPNGKWVVLAGEDGVARLWEVKLQ